MRESVGGAWVYGLVLTFVLMFTAFIALAINYNKVFRVKNDVLSFIEKYNGVNDENVKLINDYLKTSGYSMSGINCGNYKVEDQIDNTTPYEEFHQKFKSSIQEDVKNQDMCIRRIQNGDIDNYEIILFFDLKIPVVGDIFKFKVTGKTEDIHFPTTELWEK